VSGSPFVRWKPCATADELRKMVSQSDCGKLNIGAMYKQDPGNRHREREPMVPLRREFVIDIDLDDYGGIGKDDLAACDRNWPLVAVGLEVVRQVLKTGFGFEHALPVYSGRRGGHLWVCDERACCMDDAARGALTQFLSPSEGKGQKWWVELVRHPNFKDISANLMVPFFRTVGIEPIRGGGLGFFEMPFQRKNFLESIHASVLSRLESQVCAADTPAQALNLIEAHCNDGDWKWEKYQHAIWNLIGPRIDANVSKHMNHTLKAPYSVHPKTGRVSVPILHDRLDQFPVAARAPLVRDLMGEHINISKDTLTKSVEAFHRFLDKVAASETEKWVPPSVHPELKRQKVVHDLKGPTSDPDDEPVLADYPRPAMKLQRNWSLCAHENGLEMVSLYSTVVSNPNSEIVIKPGQYPPFEQEYKPTLERIASDIWRAAQTAHDWSTDGKPLHGGSKKFIMVLNKGETDWTPSTQEYASKLAKRLEEPYKVCEINMAWGRDSIESFIRQKISPFITDLYSPRSSRAPSAKSSAS
jgi:DNA primase small subunit